MKKLTMEEAALALSKEAKAIAEKLSGMEKEITDIKERYLATIRENIEVCSTAKATLILLIEENKSEFVKKKTRTLYGVKYGIVKEKGKVEVANELKTIELIRKHLAKHEDLLILKKESVVKKSLSSLTGDELKKIGVSIIDCNDKAYVGFVDDDIKKYLDELISKQTEDMVEV